jgi:predicted Zn-ribbon and HTH transcriptional regulator
MLVLMRILCQMCGHVFEKEVADPDNDRDRPSGPPVRYPKCNSTRLEPVRKLRRVG